MRDQLLNSVLFTNKLWMSGSSKNTWFLAPLLRLEIMCSLMVRCFLLASTPDLPVPRFDSAPAKWSLVQDTSIENKSWLFSVEGCITMSIFRHFFFMHSPNIEWTFSVSKMGREYTLVSLSSFLVLSRSTPPYTTDTIDCVWTSVSQTSPKSITHVANSLKSRLKFVIRVCGEAK